MKFERALVTQLGGLAVTVVSALVVTRPLFPIIWAEERITLMSVAVSVVALTTMFMVGLPRLLRPT